MGFQSIVSGHPLDIWLWGVQTNPEVFVFRVLQGSLLAKAMTVWTILERTWAFSLNSSVLLSDFASSSSSIESSDFYVGSIELILHSFQAMFVK